MLLSIKMKSSRLSHLIVSLILFITYVGGIFIACSPHHAFASIEWTTTNIEDGHTHIHTDTLSAHDESDNQQDNHCKEGNLGWMDIYVHKDSFHDLTQVDILSMISIPFFMVQERNDAYFYQERVWIYQQQLYDSEAAYANERKNTIEILI